MIFRAVDQLNNYDYQGSVLKVDLAYNGNGNGARGAYARGGGQVRPRNSGNSRGTGYPLR